MSRCLGQHLLFFGWGLPRSPRASVRLDPAEHPQLEQLLACQPEVAGFTTDALTRLTTESEVNSDFTFVAAVLAVVTGHEPTVSHLSGFNRQTRRTDDRKPPTAPRTTPRPLRAATGFVPPALPAVAPVGARQGSGPAARAGGMGNELFCRRGSTGGRGGRVAPVKVITWAAAAPAPTRPPATGENGDRGQGSAERWRGSMGVPRRLGGVGQRP